MPVSVIPNLRNNYVFIEPETNDIVDTNKATGEKVAEGRKNFVYNLFYFYSM